MDNRHITTAVIAVAGWGTRWLPLTKAIEKCMLPIGTRPVVDWVVADCVKAGIQRIIFVVGEDHQQIQQYYSHHSELEAYLSEKGKTAMLASVRQDQYKGIHFEFVTQPKSIYGTSVPVMLAAEKLGADESFVYVYGDDLIFRPDGGSEVADMIEIWQETQADIVLMAKEMSKQEATKYGVLLTDSQNHFVGIHEKPSLDELAHVSRPSVNLGKYILSPPFVRLNQGYMDQPPKQANGEYYVTDVLEQAAATQRTVLHYVRGEHLDAGTPANWLQSCQRVAENTAGL